MLKIPVARSEKLRASVGAKTVPRLQEFAHRVLMRCELKDVHSRRAEEIAKVEARG